MSRPRGRVANHGHDEAVGALHRIAHVAAVVLDQLALLQGGVQGGMSDECVRSRPDDRGSASVGRRRIGERRKVALLDHGHGGNGRRRRHVLGDLTANPS